MIGKQWTALILRLSFRLLLPVVLTLIACSGQTQREVYPSFYHWKTKFGLTGPELRSLKTLSVGGLYLRVFDVDWDVSSNAPLPIALLEKHTEIPKDVPVVPTVFITNRCFSHLNDETIPGLVDKVVQKTLTIIKDLESPALKEVQMDCDWSGETREKYFSFLRLLRSKLAGRGIALSTTIRLHQVKFYKRTGVPPVDRGVLMFYNMGNLEDPGTENSILDLEIAKRYLKNFEIYPLDLDVALPLFSWGVLFREGKMVRLLNSLDAEMMDDERFLKIGENRFELLKSTYLNGHYLYKGDWIRLEEISSELLKAAADLIAPLIRNRKINVIFYHLDSDILKKYPDETLEDICDRFR